MLYPALWNSAGTAAIHRARGRTTFPPRLISSPERSCFENRVSLDLHPNKCDQQLGARRKRKSKHVANGRRSLQIDPGSVAAETPAAVARAVAVTRAVTEARANPIAVADAGGRRSRSRRAP